MPALKPTSFRATITWLGRVSPDQGLRSQALQTAFASFDGIEGEAHGGATRPSCSRVLAQHPQGTEIRNTRQLSIVSAEELAKTAQAIGLDAIDPEWIGASMIVEGLPDFTHVPPSSRLQGPSGVTLVVDMENRPCILPGREIEIEAAGFGGRYKPAAKDRRGVTAWVEREGDLNLGDSLTLHVADQRLWAHHEAL
ncbi:sulfurase [Ascidiaceihabitans sp.]|uniref:MOSC domain-containing protein n=1 Tax=Ascidiaceihabitans sp. TaxID=1872644 RepID=UPI0032990ABC